MTAHPRHEAPRGAITLETPTQPLKPLGELYTRKVGEPAARELMDRTEGKVADIVITGNMGELVKALEAGRERLLAARQAAPALTGQEVQPQDVVVEGEVVAPANPHPELL